MADLIHDFSWGILNTSSIDASWKLANAASLDSSWIIGQLVQSGFRFGTDSGIEATPTWIALQNVDVDLSPGSSFRLRMMLNAEGDPGTSTDFQLEYRIMLEGQIPGDWKKVTTSGASFPMTFPFTLQ